MKIKRCDGRFAGEHPSHAGMVGGMEAPSRHERIYPDGKDQQVRAVVIIDPEREGTRVDPYVQVMTGVTEPATKPASVV